MLPGENFSLVSMTISKIVKTNIDCVPSAFSPVPFNCPTNSICRIAFGSTLNSFCLLKSTPISL